MLYTPTVYPQKSQKCAVYPLYTLLYTSPKVQYLYTLYTIPLPKTLPKTRQKQGSFTLGWPAPPAIYCFQGEICSAFWISRVVVHITLSA